MEKELKDSEKYKDLINIVLDYAIKNHMSLEEIENCIDKVAQAYYTDGLIIRD